VGTKAPTRAVAGWQVPKYKNKKTVVDGLKFDSKLEARRYEELKLMERAGAITDLKVHPKFKLSCGDKPILVKSKGYPNGRRATYTADFSYLRGDELVVEDTKGMDTSESRLRRAIVEAQYGIDVQRIK